ncbi:MAG: hypothetical protein OXF02_04330 [Simkaniaceae bacterium]|nr:hypothetical protein [Simkaniaceae bacterium]
MKEIPPPIEKLFDELIRHQEEKLLLSGQEIVPRLSPEDILQPNDFQELEYDPLFRYEEGVLKGIHTARAALFAYLKE